MIVSDKVVTSHPWALWFLPDMPIKDLKRL